MFHVFLRGREGVGLGFGSIANVWRLSSVITNSLYIIGVNMSIKALKMALPTVWSKHKLVLVLIGSINI